MTGQSHWWVDQDSETGLLDVQWSGWQEKLLLLLSAKIWRPSHNSILYFFCNKDEKKNYTKLFTNKLPITINVSFSCHAWQLKLQVYHETVPKK